jgi:hypothetical protein
VITIAVIAILLTKYSLAQIVEEMARGNALAMTPVAAGLAVVSLLNVALADHVVLHGILGRPGYLAVVRAKAASSLLDLLGYAVGHGSYAVWMARRGGTDALTAAGIMLYVMATDLASVCVVASIAVWSGSVDVPATIRIGAPAVAALLVFFKVVGPLQPLRDRSPRVFHPWSGLPRAHAFGQLALRVLNIYFIVVAVWLAMTVFGLPVPLWAVAVYFPVVLLVGSLPINVAGFGAVSAAWLLFEPWASGEQILAFQLLWTVFIGAAIFLRGLPFVRRMVRDIDAGAAAEIAPAGEPAQANVGSRDPA